MLDKLKLKKDITDWRLDKGLTLTDFAKKMDYSASYLWAALNPNNANGLGPKFWANVKKATNGKIKRETYYTK